MPNVTFEYKGVKITVRERIGKDVLDSPYIHTDLIDAIAQAEGKIEKGVSDYHWGRVIRFTEALQQSTIDGDLGYPWPNYEFATIGELYATYQAWLNSSPGLMGKWRDALNESNLEKLDPNE